MEISKPSHLRAEARTVLRRYRDLRDLLLELEKAADDNDTLQIERKLLAVTEEEDRLDFKSHQDPDALVRLAIALPR